MNYKASTQRRHDHRHPCDQSVQREAGNPQAKVGRKVIVEGDLPGSRDRGRQNLLQYDWYDLQGNGEEKQSSHTREQQRSRPTDPVQKP